MAGKFILDKAKNGFKFNLVAGNNEIIATSEVYVSKTNAKKGIESVRKNCTAEIEDQTVEGYATLRNPKFEIYKDKAGKFRYRLKASNGEIIASGEGYTTKQNVKNGIESIKTNAPAAEVVDKSAEA
ncbi:MAG: YegP family protein [Treponema sp.]|nr:YegP family protein [Treponema sp.]